MRSYTVTFVHPIAGQCPDATIRCNTLPDAAFSDRRKLAAALRARGILCRGQRIREMRVEGDKTIVFPTHVAGGWHSIALTCEPVRFETDTADAPEYWASYIINGDASGFSLENTPDDPECDRRIIAECDAWLERLAVQGWRVVGCSGESHEGRFRFAGRGWLYADLLTYQLLREPKVV